MDGYLLYRKDGETCVVLKTEDDDELVYLLRKLERSRVKWLRSFAEGLLKDFFAESTSGELEPPVVTQSTKQQRNTN